MSARTLEQAARACRARIRRRLRTLQAAPSPSAELLAWGVCALLAWRGWRARRVAWRNLALDGALAMLTGGSRR